MSPVSTRSAHEPHHFPERPESGGRKEERNDRRRAPQERSRCRYGQAAGRAMDEPRTSRRVGQDVAKRQGRGDLLRARRFRQQQRCRCAAGAGREGALHRGRDRGLESGGWSDDPEIDPVSRHAGEGPAEANPACAAGPLKRATLRSSRALLASPCSLAA